MIFNPKTFEVSNYVKETEGNVAVISALAIIPIISVLGFAIDWQLVSTKKSSVQHTMDATLIAAARERQAGADQADVEIFSRDQFAALIAANEPQLICAPMTIGFNAVDVSIDASVRCAQPTTLSALFGQTEVEFEVTSGSTFGVGQVDVAFVFDLSGSMNTGGKLDALKASAAVAVDALLPADAPSSDDVRISIATYNHSVNAGEFFDDVTDSLNRPSLMETSEAVGRIYEDDILGVVQIDRSNNRRFFDYETVDGSGNCTSNCNRYTDWAARFYFESSCVYNRLGDEAFTDAEPEDGNGVFAAHPLWEHFDGNSDVNRPDDFEAKRAGQTEIEDQDGEIRRGQSGRNSSVVSVSNDDNDVSSDGAFTYGIRFNGSINDGGALTSCPESEPQPLTDNRNDILNYIDDMEAVGGTAGHLGIAWGWYSLSPEWRDVWPSASRPLDYFEDETAKAMIIMTDGIFNSRNAVGDVDSNTMAAAYCDNIKENTNITIFTVGFDVPNNAPTIGSTDQTILEYCASSDEFAFDASGAQELTEAYSAIAAEISDLRISN